MDRVAEILDQARANAARAVNSSMVFAYWLIGREIVQAMQGGQVRAQYGDALIVELSKRLALAYGAGFSEANLKNFRQFYSVYADRAVPISYPSGSQSAALLSPVERTSNKSHPPGGESPTAFHPSLSWSHYRALMRVGNSAARRFYEVEAAQANWSRRDLQRQIERERSLAETGLET